MLINADVKGLEVVTAAMLSGDKVLRQEILDKVDIHDENRKAFDLGDGKPGRLLAKIFKFRLLYGGSAYAYANDPSFMGRSSVEAFWQEVIDKYYTKYHGIARWHKGLIQQAQTTGRLEIPSGRYYPIEYDEERRKWPTTVIKNYPVQGFGAELVMLARLEVAKRLREDGKQVDMVSTIHDSIVLDTPSKNVVYCYGVLKESIEKVPQICKQVWGYDFDLPLTCEIQKGMNKLHMEEMIL